MSRPYRGESHRRGYTRFWYKGDEGYFSMKRSEYEPMVEAWRRALDGKGPRLYEGTDTFGEALVVDLLEVRAIGEATPEGLERYDTEEVERADYNRDHGIVE